MVWSNSLDGLSTGLKNQRSWIVTTLLHTVKLYNTSLRSNVTRYDPVAYLQHRMVVMVHRMRVKQVIWGGYSVGVAGRTVNALPLGSGCSTHSPPTI